MEELIADACERAQRYVSSIQTRSVVPKPEDIDQLAQLATSMPDAPCDPLHVLSILDEIGSPATVASTGGRYFGFVTGGTLPAALAANWLAGAWDQNAAFAVTSPVAAALENVVLKWLRELFHFPVTSAVGFVTGATMANFTCLAAARSALLNRMGWNVEEQGLFEAPQITVIVGDEVHVSLLKALSLLGLGRARILRVPTDEQGRMRADRLPPLNDRSIVCIQAGNVNSGSFDPAVEVCSLAHRYNAWVHVDGAFGLWAGASPQRAHLTTGFSEADSWATDCHKWLNVPYDSGLAIVRESAHLHAAMITSAANLQAGSDRDPSHFTPEFSRRARVIEIWAALYSLGRKGLADMIENNCQLALRMANALRGAGCEILNEVLLNQVLVSFGASERTRRIVSKVQQEGTCWCGLTEWHGKVAMRISISCWRTTEHDVDHSAAAILRIAREVDIPR